MTDCTNDRLHQWQTAPMTDCINDRLHKWQAAQMTGWINDRLHKWQSAQMTYCTICIYLWTAQMTYCTNDILHKWQAAQMTYCINDRLHNFFSCTSDILHSCQFTHNFNRKHVFFVKKNYKLGAHPKENLKGGRRKKSRPPEDFLSISNLYICKCLRRLFIQWIGGLFLFGYFFIWELKSI